VSVTEERPAPRRGAAAKGSGSRSAARRAERNSQAALTALRQVALREFVASGYYAVSIRDLAREAGITLSVLYHYYTSKQELLYQVLNDAVDAFHTIYEQRMTEIGPGADPVSSFLLLVDATVRYRALLPNESLLFIRELRNLEPQFADRLATRRDEVAHLFAELIRAGVESGAFATPFPDDACRSLLATLNAIPNWYRNGGDITVEQLVERYQRLALVIVEYAAQKAAKGGLPQAATAPEKPRG
jgi:AcrR family transcriptional regulator